MLNEEQGRRARLEAEAQLRQQTERWAEVNDATAEIRRVRQRVGPDPFVDELARAMKSRAHHHREAT